MLEDLFEQFEGAFAFHTIRAYRSDFDKFATWCERNGHHALKASPAELAEFITWLSSSASPATVQRNIDSLSSIFTLSGRPNIARAPEVVLAMKRMYRTKGRFQRQAVPLTHTTLIALLAACGQDYQGQRDALMLRLGYETMRRRSELCQFTFEDLDTLPNGRAALHLRFSKTDQYGQGKLIPISPELSSLIEVWQTPTGGTSYLLRGVNRHGQILPSWGPASINNRLRALQKRANLDLKGQLTGHSFRVGAALDLLERGESLEKIMLRGGWKSDSTVIRYLRAWQPD